MIQERELFQAWRTAPSREALLELLRSYQNRIYNVCFQVLRHSEDAEDATQEVLLKMIDGVNTIQDHEHFRCWVYCVAANAALDARRRRLRLAAREKKVPTTNNPGTRSNEARDALHEAIAELDDELCAVVIEHYFEKATFEDLAARYGISAVAVWKKVKRAKERLKEILVSVGLSAAVPFVDSALESLVPVKPSRSLIREGVLAKITWVASIRSAPAVAAKGALGMAAKGKPASLVLVLVLAGMGGLAVVGGVARRDRAAIHQDRDHPPRSGSAWSGPHQSSHVVTSEGGKADVSTTTRRREESGRGEGETPALWSWLDAYCGLLEELREKAEGLARDWKDVHWDDNEVMNNAYSRALEESGFRKLSMQDQEARRELRRMVLENPESFLAYLEKANAQPFYYQLIDLLRDRESPESSYSGWKQQFAGFPSSLSEGLLQIALTGHPNRKWAVFRLFEHVGDQPREFGHAFLAVIEDPHSSPGIQASALRALLGGGNKIGPEHYPLIQSWIDAPATVENVLEFERKKAAVLALAAIETQEAELHLLNLAAARMDSDWSDALAEAVWTRARRARTSQWDASYAKAMASIMDSNMKWDMLFIDAALHLSPEIGAPVILKAAERMPVDEKRERWSELAEGLRNGDDVAALRAALWDGVPEAVWASP
ncbi:MAG: sigma-70 family RNA polymerase sigma factor [Planctomycetes bacterium]|nr:sigma-70 family RNA polymerase sigma factor [Planctomycetota bacterium]